MRFEITFEDVGLHKPLTRTIEAKDGDDAWGKAQAQLPALKASGRLNKQHGYVARCRSL